MPDVHPPSPPGPTCAGRERRLGPRVDTLPSNKEGPLGQHFSWLCPREPGMVAGVGATFCLHQISLNLVEFLPCAYFSLERRWSHCALDNQSFEGPWSWDRAGERTCIGSPRELGAQLILEPCV